MSSLGVITGSFSEMAFLNGVPLTPERQLELIVRYGGVDALGGWHRSALRLGVGRQHTVPVGKQTGSHLGTRDPMVVAWPEGLAARSARSSPRRTDGRDQLLPHLRRSSRRGTPQVQYFESMGGRAIYRGGWWACARHRKPWDFSPETMMRFARGVYDPENDAWEFYYLPDDFTQAHDLTAEQPEGLAELKELFWSEAEQQGAPAARRDVCVARDLAPAADRNQVPLLRRREELRAEPRA